MTKFREIKPGLYLGPQPNDADLRALNDAGVKTVIDFRDPAEVLPASNAQLARAAGLDYVGVPVSLRPMTLSDADVARTREALRTHAGPHALFCGSGARAAAMWAMQEACANAWSPERAYEEVRKLGFDLAGMPQVKAFLMDYARRCARRAA